MCPNIFFLETETPQGSSCAHTHEQASTLYCPSPGSSCHGSEQQMTQMTDRPRLIGSEETESVLARVSTAVTKNGMNKKQVGEERLY